MSSNDFQFNFNIDGGDRFERLLKSLENLAEKLDKSLDRLGSSLDRVESDFKGITRQINGFSRTLDTLQNRLKEASKTSQEITRSQRSLQTSLRKTEALTAALAERTEGAWAAISDLTSEARNLRKEQSGLASALSKSSTALGTLVGRIKKAKESQSELGKETSKVRNLMRSLETTINRARAKGNTLAAVYETIGNSAERLGSVFTNLNARLSSTSTTLTTTQNSVRRLESRLGALGDIARKSSSEFGRNFNLGNQIRNAFNSVKSVLSTLQNNLVNTFTDMARRIGSAFASTLKNTLRTALLDIPRLMTSTFTGFFSGLQQQFSNIAGQFSRLSNFSIQSGFYTAFSGGLFSNFLGRVGETVAEFNQIMDFVTTLGGLNEQQTEQMRDFINNFAQSSIFSSTEIAESVLAFLRSGIAPENIGDILPAAYNLSVAGAMSMEQATDGLIRTLAAYDKSIDASEQVVNTLVAAADISTASVEGILQAQSFAAAQAHLLGFTVEETSAMFALLNDVGITDERAGTGVRALLTALLDPSKQAMELLSESGVELKNSEGNYKSATEILQEFARVVQEIRDSGLGEGAIAEFFSGLGPRNAVSTLINLTRVTEDGTLVFEEYLKKLGEANEASVIAANALDNFQSSAKQLRTAIGVLIQKALTPLQEDILKPLYNRLRVVVNTLSQLPPVVLSTSASIIILTGLGLTFLGVSQLLFGFLVYSLVPVFSTLSLALFAIVNPLQTIISLFVFFGGLTAVTVVLSTLASLLIPIGIGFAYLFNLFRKDLGGLRSSLSSLFITLGNLLSTTIDTAISFFQLLGVFKETSFYTDETQSSLSGIERVFNSLASVINYVDGVLQGFLQRAQEMRDFFDWLAHRELPFISGLLEYGVSPFPKGSQPVVTLPPVEVPLTYTVKAGDTLYGIAGAHDITLEELLAANPNVEPPLIYPGQKIVIPGATIVQEHEVESTITPTSFKDYLKPLKSYQEINVETNEFFRMYQRVPHVFHEFFNTFINDITLMARTLGDAFIDLIQLDIESFGENIKKAFNLAKESVSSFVTFFLDMDLGRSIRRLKLTDTFFVLKEALFDLIKNVVIGSIEPLARGLIFALELTLKSLGLGFFRVILDIFDITALDPFLERVDSAIEFFTDMLRLGVDEAKAYLTGEKSVRDAVQSWIDKIEQLFEESDLQSKFEKLFDFDLSKFQVLFDLAGDVKKAFLDLINDPELKEFGQRLLELIGPSTFIIIASGLVALEQALVLVRKVLPLVNDYLKLLNDILRNLADGFESGNYGQIAINLAALGAAISIPFGVRAGLIAAGAFALAKFKVALLGLLGILKANVLVPAMLGLKRLGLSILAFVKASGGIEGLLIKLSSFKPVAFTSSLIVAYGAIRGLINVANRWREVDSLTDALEALFASPRAFWEGYGEAFEDITQFIIDLIGIDVDVSQATENLMGIADNIGTIFKIFFLTLKEQFLKAVFDFASGIGGGIISAGDALLSIFGWEENPFRQIARLKGVIGIEYAQTVVDRSITMRQPINMGELQELLNRADASLSDILDEEGISRLQEVISEEFEVGNLELVSNYQALLDILSRTYSEALNSGDINLNDEDMRSYAQRLVQETAGLLLSYVEDEDAREQIENELLAGNFSTDLALLIGTQVSSENSYTARRLLFALRGLYEGTFTPELIGLMQDGIIDGLINADYESAGQEVAERYLEGWKTMLGIRSPSVVMMEVGLDMMHGLQIGMMNNMYLIDQVINQIRAKFDSLISSLNVSLGVTSALRPAYQVTPSGKSLPVPEFASGGFTGSGHGRRGFLAYLHDEEIVVPKKGWPVMRTQEYRQNTTNSVQNISYGDVIINVPEGVREVTPDVIAEGLRMYHKQINPITNERRGRV